MESIDEVKKVRERNRQGECKECLTETNNLGDKKAMCYRYNYCPVSDTKENIKEKGLMQINITETTNKLIKRARRNIKKELVEPKIELSDDIIIRTALNDYIHWLES